MNKYRPFIILGLLITLNTRAQQPKLMLPIGHTDGVRYAQFSPDGKRVVTASIDKTAKIWDVETGALLADLKGHTGFVNEANFSPDGKKIITYSGSLLIRSEDFTVKLWDAVTGAKLADFSHNSYVVSAQFSPDGKRLVTASRDSFATIWDAVTYKKLFELKRHKGLVNSARYSNDGKRIITGSSDFTSIIWDALTGRFLKQLKGKNHLQVLNAQFSPDGSKALTIHQNRTARIWNLNTDTVLRTFIGVAVASFSPDGKKIISSNAVFTIGIVWDATSGNALFNLTHDDVVLTARFSADGKKAITGCRDGTAKIWDIEKQIATDTLEGHDDWIPYAQFSRDGKKIVTASTDGTAMVWQTGNGERLTVFKGHTQIISTANYSPDGEKIITASYDASAKIWDAANGEMLLNITGHSGGLLGADFSPDGKKIITASADSTAQVWNAENGMSEAILKGHTNWVMSAHFSPDGKNIVTASKDRTAIIWNKRYKLSETLTGHTHQVNSAEYSPDGKLIVTASNDSTAKIWNADNGKLLKTLRGHLYFVTAAHFSPDGKKIVTSSFDKTVKIWDVATGSLWQTFLNHTDWVNDAVFSPDSKKIISASEDGTMKIWDVSSSQLVGDLFADDYGINRAGFSPDGKKILMTSWSNICKVWDADRNKLLYSFFPVDSADYLVVDSSYRYDGTQAARSKLYFTCGTEVIELSQVKDELWVPGLAEQVLIGADINSKTLYQLGLCGYTPQTTLVSSTNDEYRFKITPRGGGLGETVVSVNGIEAKRLKPNQVKKANGQFEVVVKKKELDSFMVAGKENPVEVKSFAANNTVSSRGGVVNVEDNKGSAAALPVNLYAVMVGVSDYKGDSIDLRFAAKDANDMANALGTSARKHLNKDGKEHVFIYNLTTNADRYASPDKKSIKAMLDTIGKKATANDIFFIFFAGHGSMAGSAGKQQFYFLTSDAASLARTALYKDVGISSTELSEWMKPQKIKAQKRVLVFDACSSGQAITDFGRSGMITQTTAPIANKQRTEQVKAIDKLNEKSGFFILSASASGKDAYEIPKFSQGLLTYSLLRTIKINPEILEDNQYLNIGRWFTVAEKTVTDLIKENNLEQEPQIVAHNNFSVGVVDDEVMTKIIIPIDKPLFTGTGLLNSDPNVAYDDLEMGNIVNLQLNNIAARGSGRKISFLPVSKSPDACSIRGQYSVSGDIVTVIVNIIQNKKQKTQFRITGDINKLDELGVEIAMKCAEWAITNK